MDTICHNSRSNHFDISKTFHRPLSDFVDQNSLYRIITPRSVIDQFGIDQTDYTNYILSSTVYPTGVKVPLLADRRLQKCGFGIVDRRNIDISAASTASKFFGTATNKHSYFKNSSLQPMAVVEFIENPNPPLTGEKHTSTKSKILKNSDGVPCKGHEGPAVKMTNVENALKEEEKLESSNDSPKRFKDKSVSVGIPDNALGTTARGNIKACLHTCEKCKCRSQTLSTLSSNIMHKTLSISRYQTTSLPSILRSSKSISRTFTEANDNTTTSGLTVGQKSLAGTRSHSSIETAKYKPIGLVKTGAIKELIIAARWNTASKHLSINNNDSMSSKNEFPPLEIIPSLVYITDEGQRDNVKASYGCLNSRLKKDVESAKSLEKFQMQTVGKSLKMEAGKYRPHSKNDVKGYITSNTTCKSDERSLKSLKTITKYANASVATMMTRPKSFIVKSFKNGFRPCRNLISPVFNSGFTTPYSPSITPSVMSLTTRHSQNLACQAQNSNTSPNSDVKLTSQQMSTNQLKTSTIRMKYNDPLSSNLSANSSSTVDRSEAPPINAIYIPGDGKWDSTSVLSETSDSNE